MRRWLLLGLATTAGCVYPTSEPTGVELSWRFVEQATDEADETDDEADDGPRVRSCTGALTEQLAFAIADVDEPRRHGVFRFDCLTGFQTAVELQRAASDAFVRLEPGAYTITAFAVDDAQNASIAERVAEREVDVAEREVTVEIWELVRTPVRWDLELRGVAACEALTLSLVYASPEADLPELAPTDDDATMLYRPGLQSDRGLGVGGEAVACEAGLAGVHRFEAIDRGDYLLELDVDGRACAVRVDLRDADGATSVIDLASLPCEG